MTQFSSKPPFRAEGAKDASVRNDDPEPWLYELSHIGPARKSTPDIHTWYAPRPEYDRPQHNPTNPILVARRNNPGEPIYYRNLERWPTWEEVEHARKVLTRRKAVFG